MDKSAWMKIIAGAVIALFGSLLIAVLKEWFGTEIMLLSVFVPISIFATYFGFVAYNKLEKILELHNKRIEQFDELVNYSRNRFNSGERLSWIYTEDYLIEIEKKKKSLKNIWIINPDPTDDTAPKWMNAIQNNILEGTVYTYVSPKRDTLGGAIMGLKTVFREGLNQCKIVKLQEEEFKRLPFESLVVYDPENNSDETDCYAEILGQERGYWFSVPVRKRNEIIGTLSEIVISAKPLSDL